MNLASRAILASCCLITACYHPHKKATAYPDTLANGKILVLRTDSTVSLIRLIASPEKYDGKKVRVIGYLHLEFEGDALYLHKEDYNAAISKNGLWINISRDSATRAMKYNNRYIIMEGVFDAKSYGHMGMFSGSLKDITRLDLWYQPNDKQ